jgi:hypothetical protein
MQHFLDHYRPVWQAPDDPGGTPTPPDPAGGTPTPLPSDPGATPPSEARTLDPLQQRIDAITAQRWSEKRRADQAEARARLAEETLAELRRLEAPDPVTTTTTTPAPASGAGGPVHPAAVRDPPGTIRMTPEQLAERVRQEAFKQEYDRRVNDTVAEGRRAHKDFDESIVKLKSITGPDVPPELVVAAMETGRGGDVLRALGQDLGEADRILQLPPARMAVELTRFADRLAAPDADAGDGTPAPTVRVERQVSRAPAPIASRVGGGAPARELDIESPQAADPEKGLSTAEWMKRRNADVAKKRQNGAQIR